MNPDNKTTDGAINQLQVTDMVPISLNTVLATVVGTSAVSNGCPPVNYFNLVSVRSSCPIHQSVSTAVVLSFCPTEAEDQHYFGLLLLQGIPTLPLTIVLLGPRYRYLVSYQFYTYKVPLSHLAKVVISGCPKYISLSAAVTVPNCSCQYSVCDIYIVM